MTPNRLINHDVTIERAALKYAELGWYPIPLHVPIIHEGGRTGCSCEAYKRSEQYRQYLVERGQGHRFDAGYCCSNQGKHPIGHDWETTATQEADEIRRRFRQRHTIDVDTGQRVAYYPNIGIATGPSGLLVLDADSYKDRFEGRDFLTLAERHTITAISGGGGEHLVYDRGAASYGNTTGLLPGGLDIRGVGGQFAVSPSLHRSGRRYQWETGFGPLDMTARPLPFSLRSILEAAHQQKQARATAAAALTVAFGAVGSEAPNLERWNLPESVQEMIEQPAPKGSRSEHDYFVVIKLCEASASDDDILAIFTHYPIGAAGKYAERGLDYLARTITNARAALAEQEQKRRRILATIESLRLWARTTSFASFIPAELVGSHYRSDSTDTKLFDAICDGFAEAGQLSTQAGKKRLAKAAGFGSCNTVLRALSRLSFAFDVQPGAEHGMVITLRPEFCFAQIDPLLPSPNCDQGITLREANEYSPRKATDPFLTGTSHQIKQRCKAEAAACDRLLQSIDGSTFQQILKGIPKGLGETCLRVLDALKRAGEMTAQELAEETGKTKGAIWRACRRLELEGLIGGYQEYPRAPKVYSLMPDVWRQVDELSPTLRTYGLSAEREDRRLKEAQLWAKRQEAKAQAAGDQETVKQVQAHFNRLGNQRLKVLEQVHAARLSAGAMTQKDLATLAFDVQIPITPHPAVLAKLERLHETAKMDVAEQRRRDQWQLTQTAQELHHQGLGKKDAVRQLEYAGYTPNESWAAVKRVWPASYTSAEASL